jgi:fructose-bisphosphate aldolase class II
MIVTTAELFKHAYGKYAIGAYNINNLEQTMGLFKGNVESKAPFIVQLSKGARSYTHKLMLESMMQTADKIFPDAVFAVHLDHGDDASHHPIEKNIEITKRVVKAAHAKGIVVEAELGQLKGIEEDVSAAEHVYTKPEEAEYFVKQTGIDSLACAIGTSHGAFKFKGDQKLRFDILEKIQKLLPGFPLVMHGSSSVPQDEVARINAAGGAIKGASGVDASQFLGAAKLGVTKINIDTDGRLVWCRVHRECFRDHPEKFDLRDPGKVFIPEYAKFIAQKNVLLGSAGQLDACRAACTKR